MFLFKVVKRADRKNVLTNSRKIMLNKMKCLNYIFVLAIYWSAKFTFADQAGIIGNEARLREELFVKRKINSQTRPKQIPESKRINVEVGLRIRQIISLDEKTETLTMNAWFFKVWFDANLSWKPDDYGEISTLQVPLDDVWKPDLQLINKADDSPSLPYAKLILFLVNTGNIYWWPPSTFQSICPLNLKAFPFDQHTCNLHFASMSDTGSDYNFTLNNQGSHLSRYLFEHKEWKIISTHGNLTTHLFIDENDDINISIINFYITLERRLPYYYLALITPSIIAVLATFLTFWTSPSSAQKLFASGVNVTILLIFIINLFWIVPRSGSSVPGIVIFCGNAAFFAGLTFLLSITTVAMYNNPPTFSPPIWLTDLLNGWLSAVLCLSDNSIGNSKLLDNKDDTENTAREFSDVQLQWQLVACVLDRIGFVLYSIIMSIILIVAFA